MGFNGQAMFRNALLFGKVFEIGFGVFVVGKDV